jgi:isoleucyl-tRNA synthetase
VRLSRKRFWGGEFTADKISAYQTLYTCLETVAKLMAPIAPFYADLLFSDLNCVTKKEKDQSVHLANFPEYDEALIDNDLEEKMGIAQKASSMILALRRKEKLKVRQPLTKIMVPVLHPHFREQFDAVKNIILTEVNVKEVEYLEDTTGLIKKKIKPNFKTLGPKYGKLMKMIAAAVNQLNQEQVSLLEKQGELEITAGDEQIVLSKDDVEIQTEDIPGWTVATEGQLTIALDINVTDELRQEGIAREFINKIQNLRKESSFEVTDRIKLKILKQHEINDAVENFREYICTQTLAAELQLVDELSESSAKTVEIDKGIDTLISVEKLK